MKPYSILVLPMFLISISAELNGSIVSGVKITSENGCDCIIQNPWPDKTVHFIRNGKPAETVSSPRFTLKTAIKETIALKEE